ncbi:MAG: hypothetical protein A2381_14490 [Bdellovibrionales bacterium RIFOXYB1_FULL_37_110]|nr:MAG: hypothetical protein A2417_03150 [Bdellovibrionales bacterium RIFOXYC1_FULL_37_79]OFZ58348.1 MAG: hypothetical protein A2381_14490 [Bdellovibrionales bacterium RIFOXYB1_FULL_37_110]OFZ62686.1 MAG: hypothetical protein A2577_02200 [Bdellovibrionales bacterium RIFOXYD1_FULL_36_51]
MQIFSHFLKSPAKAENVIPPSLLNHYFDEMINHPDSPFVLAIEDLKKLEETSDSTQEYLEYLLEDTIFISLHLTFYEKLFIVLGQHPHLAIEMMDKFSEDIKEREFIIGQETFCHVQYIENHGICQGCKAHDNHQDVFALIEHYFNQNIDFFIQLYLGMQTIQYSFDKLLYDILPENKTLLALQSEQTILEFRKYIFNYVSNELK